MLTSDQLIFDVVTRDALLILGGNIHQLDGPFQTRDHAEAAARVVINRLASDVSQPSNLIDDGVTQPRINEENPLLTDL